MRRAIFAAAFIAFVSAGANVASADSEGCGAIKSTNVPFIVTMSTTGTVGETPPKTMASSTEVIRSDNGGYEYRTLAADGLAPTGQISHYSSDFLAVWHKLPGASGLSNTLHYKKPPPDDWYRQRSTIDFDRSHLHASGRLVMRETVRLAFVGTEKVKVSGCVFDTDIIRAEAIWINAQKMVTQVSTEYRYSPELKVVLVMSQVQRPVGQDDKPPATTIRVQVVTDIVRR